MPSGKTLREMKKEAQKEAKEMVDARTILRRDSDRSIIATVLSFSESTTLDKLHEFSVIDKMSKAHIKSILDDFVKNGYLLVDEDRYIPTKRLENGVSKTSTTVELLISTSPLPAIQRAR